jgi:hypothetical protein
MKFQILYLCCDDPLFACECELYCFLERIWELFLSRTRTNSCPLAQNPQKIFNSGIINTVQ